MQVQAINKEENKNVLSNLRFGKKNLSLADISDLFNLFLIVVLVQVFTVCPGGWFILSASHEIHLVLV